MLNVMHFAEKQLNETDANLYASSFYLQTELADQSYGSSVGWRPIKATVTLTKSGPVI